MNIPVFTRACIHTQFTPGGALRRIGEAMGGSEEAPAWAGSHPRGMGPEDMLTSRTLLPLGVPAQESVDEHGRQLFMAMGIDFEYYAPKRDETSWFYKYEIFFSTTPLFVFPALHCCGFKMEWASHY